MAAVDTVVFDVGHVLYDWDIRHLYRKLIADPADLEHFVSEVVTREWHFQHDAGRPYAETTAELTARFPEHAERIAAYAPRWLETIGEPLPGMLELVAELDAAGTPLYAITNFSAEFWAMFRPTAPVFDRFRDVLVSGAEKLVKPDPAIFALAIQRWGLDPARCLFVDDRADNVAAAQAAGMAGHVFSGEPELRTRLVAAGILQVR